MSETNPPNPQPGSDRGQPPTPVSEADEASADVATELATTRDRLLRCLAEQENVRRQAQRDRAEAVRYAASRFASDLLVTADNLERAIASVPQENRTDPTIVGLLAGIEATHRALLDAFARHGLRRLDPIGEKFDPNWHEASFELADARHPPGAVASVLQPGYVHHERLLRPALVAVNKAPKPSAVPEEGNRRDP
jgi:molecular chaperone GrpE